MENWLKIRSIAQRRIVVVSGKDSYYEDRIRRWWIENQPKRKLVELPNKKKEFQQELVRLFSPTVFSAPRSIVIPEFPSEVDLMSVVREIFEAEDESSALIYTGTTEIDDSTFNWIRRRSASKMGVIFLKGRGKFDRRKMKWAQEISNHYDLLFDDRACRYLLDWAGWDLGIFESEVIKISLMIGKSDKEKLIGINFLEQFFPSDDKTTDFSRLVGNGAENYFSALDSNYLENSASDQKEVLNRHLRMVEQIRLLVFIDRTKTLEDQMDAIRKMSKFPVTEQQISSLLARGGFSDAECLRFLSHSSKWILSRILQR